MIIERSISFRDTFQLVIKIDNNLTQRQIIDQLNSVTRNIFLLDKLSSFSQTKRHNRPDIIGCRYNRGPYIRFFYFFYQSRIGQTGRIMYLCHISFFIIYFIGYIRYCSDNVHIKFSIEPFLNYLHV